LNQKVETVMELRGKTIEQERIEADKEINTRRKKVVEEENSANKRKIAPKEATGNDQ
jgi:hypothetical protein